MLLKFCFFTSTKPSFATIQLSFPRTTRPTTERTKYHIHLGTNSGLVNVKPYQYPYFQKMEIEKLITEMLNSEIIRHSTSTYSSSLLVKKKAMLLCGLQSIEFFNYKRSFFPIPTIVNSQMNSTNKIRFTFGISSNTNE